MGAAPFIDNLAADLKSPTVAWSAAVHPYRRLLGSLRPHAGLLAGAIAAMALLSGATGLFSWLVGPLFQFVFKGGNVGTELVQRTFPWLDASRIDRELLLRALPILILAIS